MQVGAVVGNSKLFEDDAKSIVVVKHPNRAKSVRDYVIYRINIDNRRRRTGALFIRSRWIAKN
jgi:hypothetical protein